MHTVTDIVVVRHPETQANVTGTLVGRGDSPYTSAGRTQLARVPRALALLEPTAVYTSPLRRTVVLGRSIARRSEAPLFVDERLVEIDFGVAEGLTIHEAREQGILLRYDAEDVPVAPGGESRSQVWERVGDLMDELVVMGGTRIVVTHGGPFRAAVARLLGLSSEHIWSFHVRNVQIAHIRVTDGWGTLERYEQG